MFAATTHTYTETIEWFRCRSNRSWRSCGLLVALVSSPPTPAAACRGRHILRGEAERETGIQPAIQANEMLFNKIKQCPRVDNGWCAGCCNRPPVVLALIILLNCCRVDGSTVRGRRHRCDSFLFRFKFIMNIPNIFLILFDWHKCRDVVAGWCYSRPIFTFVDSLTCVLCSSGVTRALDLLIYWASQGSGAIIRGRNETMV